VFRDRDKDHMDQRFGPELSRSRSGAIGRFDKIRSESRGFFFSLSGKQELRFAHNDDSGSLSCVFLITVLYLYFNCSCL